MKKVSITFTRGQEVQSFALREGLGIQALAQQCSWLEFDCRKADCGICIAWVRSGADTLSAPTAAEADFLRAMQAEPDERLLCQCRAFGDASFEIDDFQPS